MLDMTEIGNSFYDILQDMGETITVAFMQDLVYNEVQLRASIVPATKAAYNMVDREYLFMGDMTLDESIPLNILRGCYFTRNIYAGYKYLMLSVIPNPANTKMLSNIYACQCNEIISVQQLSKVYDPVISEYVEGWNNIHENIDVFFNTVVRSEKSTQDGSFDQAIYTLIVPAKYAVSPNQRVIKKSFVNGILTDIAYKVESADMSLVDIGINGEIWGVVFYQLSKDIIM